MQVQARYPGVIELEVDASDIERRIQRVNAAVMLGQLLDFENRCGCRHGGCFHNEWAES